jgi:pimeloyl-ACP methyl ester carboxylesterase
MTLSALQASRKTVPFAISMACVVPWIAMRAQSVGECALVVVFALAAGFLYMILDLRGPIWQREKNRYVDTQIRDNLINLIPKDIHVTAEERQQLANSQILGDLGGIFWNTIDQDDVLRSHKQHFYSNGFAYTTSFDGFLLCAVFGVCYAAGSLVLSDSNLLIAGVGLILVGVICRSLAVAARRRRHLDLSREQLNLLKQEKGDFITERFRHIVLGWRAQGRPAAVVPADLPERSSLRKELIAGFCFVGAFVALAFLSRGWFGPGPNVKIAPEVKSGYVTEGSHNKVAAVVFVHGIFGTKDDTWLSADHNATFPRLLATDPALKDRVDVFAFEYFTPKFGAAPSIVDLADQLRGDLDDKRVFEDHQKVAFLAHSMGGLVVREYLLNNQIRIQKVPMVFFYATPTNGAEMARVGQLVSANPQLRGMVPIEGNDLLQSIQSGWMDSGQTKSIASYCGVEELPTAGIMIVTRSSATSLCNQPLDPFSANHIEIVKPPNREDSRYTRFVSALYKDVLTADSKAAVTPEGEKFEFEIDTRADGADRALDGLAKMTWLDGDSNTGSGTSLRFAGNAISGAMYNLDHPRDGVPEFENVAFLPLMLAFKRRVPGARVDQLIATYKRIKEFCDSQPKYEDVDRKLAREKVSEAIQRLRKDVSALRAKGPSPPPPAPLPDKPTLVVDTTVDEPRKVAIEIRNTGRGVAHVHTMRTFVSGHYVQDGGNPDHGIPVLRELGTHSDIHWRYPGDQGYEIPPKGVTAIWWLDDMSEKSVEDFKSLIRGLALEVCYCSDQGECQWTVFKRKVPDGNCQ